jgi:crotonobetainyl-CoA:carnitine CoA-transferase CaiB-like acyl-CoA transferase
VFSDPQVKHLGIAVPVKDSERGDVRVVGQPIVMSRTPASVLVSVPGVGEHNEEVLSELGYSASAIAQLRNEKVM